MERDGCGLNGDAACSFSGKEVGYCRAFVDICGMLDTIHTQILILVYDEIWNGDGKA